MREMTNVGGSTEPPQNAARRWLSVHLPFAGDIYTADCDQLLRDIVGPLIERLESSRGLAGLFFIRYREAVSHLRFRMLPVAECERARIRELVERAWALQRSEGFSAAWVEYEPELDRYGGEAAMPAAERLFEASSRFALAAVTPGVSADRSIRLGRAMLATLTALHSLVGTRDGVGAFARSYADTYILTQRPSEARRSAVTRSFDANAALDFDSIQQYLECAWEQLEEGEPLLPALDSYREALIRYRWDIEALLPTGCVAVRGRPIRDWTIAASMLGASMIHMTNNRLGISIPEETYVAHLIHRVFDAAER